MNKKELILNTMQELFREGKAGAASVSDIAKRAGIAKGGLYYYFRSKEEVMDALVEREYAHIIQNCENIFNNNSLNATNKFVLLLHNFNNAYIDPSLNEYLHQPQNAGIHQKALAKLILSLSKLVSAIIEQGIQEGIYQCEYPEEYAQIILSVFTFLLDQSIFDWTPAQRIQKLEALASLIENGLSTEKGSFSFLYKI